MSVYDTHTRWCELIDLGLMLTIDLGNQDASSMEIEAYIDRIGYRDSCEPTIDTLVRLHRAHMFTVPFENLDIPLGRRITLSLPEIYEGMKRGGKKRGRESLIENIQ